ncbi:MAG: CARDB domain-containing protein [Candidatus Bathyarchaeia archaeon]
MSRNEIYLIVLMCVGVMFGAAVMSFSIIAASPTTPILAVSPSTIVYDSFVEGQRFTVDVTVSNVTNLKCYEFKLSFNKDMLSVVGVELLFKDKLPSWDSHITSGTIWMNVTFEGGSVTTTTPAALVTITFEIKNYGESLLHLFDTTLLDSTGAHISHETSDGTVIVGFHDVAVVGLVASTHETYVGRMVQVNVTVQNLGTASENLNVKFYHNDTEFFVTSTFSLASGENLTITCTWDTSDVLPGNTYVLKAEASAVPYEANVTNNVVDGVSVKVKIIGDINNDNIVNIDDLIAWDHAFGSHVGEPNWNPQADLNDDGIVDKDDGILIIQNYLNSA